MLLLDDVGTDGCLEDIGESEGVVGLAAVGAEDADSGTGRHDGDGEEGCAVGLVKWWMSDDKVNWRSFSFASSEVCGSFRYLFPLCPSACL